jgi:PTS system nitrogen regulatory IIA component
MIHLSEVLTTDQIWLDVELPSKKKTLERLSEYFEAAQVGLPAADVFVQLSEREKLGSTGLGHGVALPHCRMEQCQKPIAIALRLAQPIAFDAVDNKPIDLVFALIVPGTADRQHLELLAQVAKRFGDASRRDALRSATSADLFLTELSRD